MTDQKPCTCGSKEMAIFMADRGGFVCLQCDGIRGPSQAHRDYREAVELMMLKAVFGGPFKRKENLKSLRKWRDQEREKINRPYAPEIWEP